MKALTLEVPKENTSCSSEKVSSYLDDSDLQSFLLPGTSHFTKVFDRSRNTPAWYICEWTETPERTQLGECVGRLTSKADLSCFPMSPVSSLGRGRGWWAKEFKMKLILINSNWKHTTWEYYKGNEDQISMFLSDYKLLLWIIQVSFSKTRCCTWQKAPDRHSVLTDLLFISAFFVCSELRNSTRPKGKASSVCHRHSGSHCYIIEY